MKKDPDPATIVRYPLRTPNNGNRNENPIVNVPRVPKPKRTREECDAELLDFLVEKTLQSFMPLAKPAVARAPHRRSKHRKAA